MNRRNASALYNLWQDAHAVIQGFTLKNVRPDSLSSQE